MQVLLPYWSSDCVFAVSSQIVVAFSSIQPNTSAGPPSVEVNIVEVNVEQRGVLRAIGIELTIKFHLDVVSQVIPVKAD